MSKCSFRNTKSTYLLPPQAILQNIWYGEVLNLSAIYLTLSLRLGHVFVTSLVLGGQQRTSKYAASLEMSNEEVQQDALRSAIGVSVNAQYVSASAKKTTEQGKSQNRSGQKYSDLSYLGMSAIGGDPLIGSE